MVWSSLRIIKTETVSLDVNFMEKVDNSINADAFATVEPICQIPIIQQDSRFVEGTVGSIQPPNLLVSLSGAWLSELDSDQRGGNLTAIHSLKLRMVLPNNQYILYVIIHIGCIDTYSM